MTRVNKKAPPHYLVTVEGFYAYKDSDGEKKRRAYSFDIPVPITVTAAIPIKQFDAQRQTHFWQDVQKTLNITDYGILSYLIREQRIQNRIRKETQDFVCLLKHEITNLKPSSPDVPLPSNPHVLNKGQLLKFVKSNGWPIDTNLFPSLKELREAVLNFKESPESYEVFETLKRRRGAAGTAFTMAQEELENFYGDNQPQEESPSVLPDPEV